MQFYYAEEPASPLDFNDDDAGDNGGVRDSDHLAGDSFCAVSTSAALAAKSMAPAISRAGAFRELTHSITRAAVVR